MGDTPAFLTRLGLTADTDKQTIRRTYARKLKQIDQEADAESFQALREAYDAALEWLDRRPEPADAAPATPDFGLRRVPITLKSTHASASPPKEALPAGIPEDPFRLARAVFDEFAMACPELVSGPQSHQKDPWVAALEQYRNDPRLFNIAAMEMFEAMIAQRLATGWVPGNEVLLIAANDVFRWSTDRRKLTQFGHLGALINRALDEHIMFNGQAEAESRRQRIIIARLREPGVPDAERLHRDVPHLAYMQSCFPVWLPMVAPVDSIELWHRAYEALPGALPGARTDKSIDTDTSHGPPRGTAGIRRFFGRRMLAALIIIWIVRSCLDGPSKPQLSAPGRPEGGPSNTVFVSNLPSIPPTKERLDEIAARINYKSAAPVRKGTKLEAAFDVFLDADGSVLGVNRVRGSGDKAYDDAVAQAIKTSLPFPIETEKKFRAQYALTK